MIKLATDEISTLLWIFHGNLPRILMAEIPELPKFLIVIKNLLFFQGLTTYGM